jgi:alpha-glucosidase
MLPAKTLANSPSDWWRHAVIYQIYPRSFADGNGDGVGDLAGIISRLPAIAELGVDAIWLSPFYRSPQKDAGYDVSDYCDVDPIFGTLAEAETLITTAHDLGLRIIVDVVPNHSSDQHEWFQAALAAEPRSPERERYMFRDGHGETGEFPPNNWESVFGGPAWSRTTNPDGSAGQWYLHIFDQSQPDFNWENPEVWNLFDGVLRFWLDRGVDGFRVDVAHGLVKEAGLPNRDLTDGPPNPGEGSPFWDQDGVHEVYRAWRKILDQYGDDRMMCAEAWVMPLSKMAHYVRPDEMHQAFNFGYLASSWDSAALRAVIDESLGAFGGVGAPSTWVLSNHDVIRHRSRLATNVTEEGQPTGIGPKSEHKPDEELGHHRGRAATALMLGLPGSAYLFQGEELGLPEVIDIPDDRRDDPTFFRTRGERYGRDGCRVPIPWEADKPAYGFNDSGASWLPQPAVFGELARDQQQGLESSTLELYRRLLSLRASHGLGSGDFSWLPGFPESTVAFRNLGIAVIGNLGTPPITLPAGEILASSGPLVDGELPGDTTAWIWLAN